MINFVLALATAISAPPSAASPLTPDHLRDIGCVAVMAIIADAQNSGVVGADTLPRTAAAGRSWAGIVGARVADQSGQPVELSAFAMREAAANEQAAMNIGANRAAALSLRYAACAPLMRADLEADLASKPLPPPTQKAAEKSQ